MRRQMPSPLAPAPGTGWLILPLTQIKANVRHFRCLTFNLSSRPRGHLLSAIKVPCGFSPPCFCVCVCVCVCACVCVCVCVRACVRACVCKSNYFHPVFPVCDLSSYL